MIALRKARPSLRRGTYETLLAHNGVHAHLRQFAGESVAVALNASLATRRVDIPLLGQIPDGTTLDEVWTRESATVVGGMLRDVRIDPRSGKVFATPIVP